MAQFTWQGVDFQERNESKGVSPEESIENDRMEVTRVYDVAWTDRLKATEALLGYAWVDNSSGNPFLRRITPHPHVEWKIGQNRPTPLLGAVPPLRIGKNYLYATKVKIQGIGSASPNLLSVADYYGVAMRVPVYNKARLTTTYQSLPWDVEEDTFAGGQNLITTAPGPVGSPDESRWFRYVTKVIRPTSEYFTLPAGSMVQVGGNSDTIEIGVAKSLGFGNIMVTWHQVPEEAVPSKYINPELTDAMSTIERLLGTVNDRNYYIAAPNALPSLTSVAFNKGTLLLLAAELKPYRSPFGLRIYDITYHFKHFGPGREGNVGETTATGDQGGTSVTTRNHQKIFRALPSQAGGAASPGWYEIVNNLTNGATTNFVIQAANTSIYEWGDHRKLFRPRTQP